MITVETIGNRINARDLRGSLAPETTGASDRNELSDDDPPTAISTTRDELRGFAAGSDVGAKRIKIDMWCGLASTRVVTSGRGRVCFSAYLSGAFVQIH